ncbi:MAG: polysaccharide deacetylase family protein [Actinomycetota bacterium]|nr:polysaccharide deacetylase family protein [Actinomycetota bacterium]
MSSNGTVTIIGYHAIEEGPGPLCLPPAVFERQVRTLHDDGCTALTVAEVADHLRTGAPFPERAIALTFDDGYASVHRHALPLLSSLGYRATIYPVTSQLGGHNRWDAPWRWVPRLAVVEPPQLQELAAAGWEVGGHTHTHPSLAGQPPDVVAAELAESTAILEALCGTSVRTFAYPYGDHDRPSRQVAVARHDACLGIGARKVTVRSGLDQLDRVDAWYLRRRWQLRGLHGPAGDGYLFLRRVARVAGERLRAGHRLGVAAAG